MPNKRPLTPNLLPPPKRLHTSDNPPSIPHAPRPNFDTLLYDEIILLIFSYLSWTDLCAIQRTNRNWSRLALDNQLWKAQYLSEYGRSRLRGVRGFIGRADGREIRPLPGRAHSEGIKDWKWMFRISSNWRTGRCSVEALQTGLNFPLSDRTLLPSSSDSQGVQDQTFLIISGSMTITASSRASSHPVLTLIDTTHGTHTLRSASTRPSATVQVTALALDQCPPTTTHHARLVSFLSTGEFVLFSIDHHTPTHSSRLFTYVPNSRTSRTAPIIQAVYHHPLLVTLSQSFHLSLYDLSNDNVAHTQTLTSFTSHPPSSLVLSTPSPGTYKLVLAYAIPVYPSHWSVGATELMVASEAGGRMAVTGTRTARAIDVPQGWIDENKLRLMREQWSRKVARVADTQTDGKWVVLAPGDAVPTSTAEKNAVGSPSSSSASSSPPSSPSRSPHSSLYTSSSLHSANALQLYRLYLPASSSPTAMPKLTFVRSLHGQIGPVSALSLADGRCVSLGVNGSIWVWDLEGGTGAEVSSGRVAVAHAIDEVESEETRLRAASGVKGTVVFDERRIISVGTDGVQVWRFDV
ncbi:uncharacterized protein LAESUDRAFT_727838 [Laetiporus sulphureus 93-53]|uniref:F-box domain-containing protein n=1 Tax=Laetiporus sulphureus 93-53 TaxID=1314785 RepID=A0A165DDS5_9APHY|nr:uncharacterized protein LAESUDRAFT_727838 [Laetiporus sulphureus 93-53]KZT04657.1 hypothetical protein LAESUDRAFT_727838 [Laetiporus sulphureus 93-53]